MLQVDPTNGTASLGLFSNSFTATSAAMLNVEKKRHALDLPTIQDVALYSIKE